MPYLTPDEIPEGDDCRPLSIPASTDWLAIVSGALTELTKPWNWEQEGAVTVDEAVAAMQAMVNAYYAGSCATCELPEGGLIARLSPLGTWEVLDGEWVAPYGDYALPAYTARTESTADERKCLAAKNAVNVLQMTYEEMADLASLYTDIATLIFNFSIFIGAVIAGPVGLLAASAMVIGIRAVEFAFAITEVVTEDVWSTDFTDGLVCVFLNNATDTAGVVTFDFAGAQSDMLNMGLVLDLTFRQQQLVTQVNFMFEVIGAEGLNLAGETTAITDSDCSGCVETWRRCWLTGYGLGDWNTPCVVPDDARSAGVYNSGTDKIDSTAINIFGDEWANFELIENLDINGINIAYDYINSGTGSLTWWVNGTLVDYQTFGAGTGTGGLVWTGDGSGVTSIQVRLAVLGSCQITRIVMDGTGTPPASGSDCG